MKQLNNTKNNTIIRIIKIDPKSNNITLQRSIIILNGNIKTLKNIDNPFNFNLSELNIKETFKLKLNDSLENLCYFELLKDAQFKDYVLSDNAQNWLHGSRGFRLIIENNKNSIAQAKDGDYATLVKTLRDRHSEYIYTNEVYTIIYVSQLITSELSIAINYLYSKTVNPTGFIYVEVKKEV